MKIEACLDLLDGAIGPDPWDESYGISLPLNHVICRDVDSNSHTIGEFIWPWTAYHAHKKKVLLHFFYWQIGPGSGKALQQEITHEREARIRELQFLMTRRIYFGNEKAALTLFDYLVSLKHLARFAESRSCTVRDVLEQTSLMDAFGAHIPIHYVAKWMGWLTFLAQLDTESQLGFTLATPKQWKDLDRRAKKSRDNSRQYAPLPTRVFGETINNLSAELDDIETHKKPLLAVLREAITRYRQAKSIQTINKFSIGPALIEKHGLVEYLAKRQLSGELAGLAGAVTEVFHLCKLQLHAFSGMRKSEAANLPFHCMVKEKGRHGRTHCLISGFTTKLAGGRRLRTKWVTTEKDGFRAIRLAQEFSTVIYEALGIKPSKADDKKDEHPLFPSTSYLGWVTRQTLSTDRITPFQSKAKDSLFARLCPIIEEADIAELDEIDPFRAWREEPEFAIGKRWPLTTHQLRRSIALYANASGLVRISSLRRQLQHLTREMSLYYGRGSTFCKNFIETDPNSFKEHIAIDWQEGDDEAQMLAFVRDVLNSPEQMFGGAGNFYQQQRKRHEVISREEVSKQMKAGLLAYKDGPLGGCTKLGVCDTRKGLTLIDTICATEHCKHLVGKHSKVIQVIKYKRASMMHITPGSITETMEKEDLAALERVELAWRPQNNPVATQSGDMHA